MTSGPGLDDVDGDGFNYIYELESLRRYEFGPQLTPMSLIYNINVIIR
jgi:hypothetical protein